MSAGPARRSAGRRPAWLLVAGGVSLLALLLPVAASLFGGDAAGPRTAFASAPAGNYAVVVRTDGAVDIVEGVNAATGEMFELARIPHIDGYTSYASVSPDGQRLAAVVADLGQKASPVGTLLFIDLETGESTRAIEDIDQLQQPLWSNDSASAVVTRTAQSETALASVQFLRAQVSPVEQRVIGEVPASGAYPVAFDAEGRLLVVALDLEGSTLLRDFAPLLQLAPGATRDWRLSPDAKALAYVEVVTDGGLQFHPRLVDLQDGVKGSVSGQSAAEGGETIQGLGVAWEPSSNSPVFGFERGENPSGASAQSSMTDSGFDVPLGFAADGQALAVQHWSGETFDAPGEFTIQVHSPAGIRPIDSASRFYGWARR